MTRGDQRARRILRAVYEPSFGVDRISVDGRPIEYGGRLADAVQVVASVLALGVPPRPRGCLTSCCRNPARPDCFAFPGRGQSCADLRWEPFSPGHGAGTHRPAWPGDGPVLRKRARAD